MCLCILFSGCGSTTISDLPYSQDTSHSSDLNITAINSKPEGDLFSKNVCIVDLEHNDTNSDITAKSSIIINNKNNTVIFASNPHEKLYPASTTKILTAYLTLKYANLDDMVTISHEAANISDSGAKKCGFNENDKVSVRDLLYCTLIYSGNDAATALACHISGTENEFAKLMNKEVALMGATKTHFTNANGLHNDDHYTTAYDLYIIMKNCILYDEFKSIINMNNCTVNYTDANDNKIEKTFYTTNKFMTGKYSAPSGITVLGGKTGTTKKAGSCLVLFSENTDGHSFISVVLDAESNDYLYMNMKTLLELT